MFKLFFSIFISKLIIQIGCQRSMYFFFMTKKKRDPDTPNYVEAMTGENAEDYRKAMDEKLYGLSKRET